MYLPNQKANQELLFVYGTLKRGFSGNETFLKDSEFCGMGKTLHKYTMVDFGKYPGVILSKPTCRISGELYSVPNLSLTDNYEGYPNYYSRTKVFIFPDIDAWIYHLPEVYLIGHPIIPDGIWKK